MKLKKFFAECKRKSDEGEWEWITENFDTFFAIARANNQVPWEFRRRLFMTLFEGLICHFSYLLNPILQASKTWESL